MSLEAKKKALELERVTLARKELEFKIEEKMEEIERIKAHIEVQFLAEDKLRNEINNLKSK